ncbi:hypothetical protein BZA77DRAFT_384900 [Pyronema omphalodes]|nr:hypothetical protein BZA77DRAFT_384900 [Pyronema omphalodes]
MSSSNNDIKHLRSEIDSLKELLRSFHQSQQLQTQALQKFLAQPGHTSLSRNSSLSRHTSLRTSIIAPIIRTRPAATDSTLTETSSANPDPTIQDDTGITIDEETQSWLDNGHDLASLQSHITIAREHTFTRGIPSRSQALQHLVRDGWLNEADEPDEEPHVRFMTAAGPGCPQRTVKVRDFYDMDCRSFLLFYLKTDEELWRFLARPRSKGSRTMKGKKVVHDKVKGFRGRNVDGKGTYPAYGREIIINEITPNIALMLLVYANEMCRKHVDVWEPVYTLQFSLAHAVDPGESSFTSDLGYYKRYLFSFDATYFEFYEDEEDVGARETVDVAETAEENTHGDVENGIDDDDDDSDDDEGQRPAPVYDISGKGEFGSIMKGEFAPGESDTPLIRETTLSLIFDCLEAEDGSYWTLFSLGKYKEEATFSKKAGTRQEEMPRYYSPEEIFLDKLARVIDYVVDDGMSAVLQRLDDYLDIPLETLLSKEDSERLLFDDTRFTRTKKYHWAMQWLGKMTRCMETLIKEIDRMEYSGLDFLEKAAFRHKQRAGITHQKSRGLQTKKAFLQKAARAREVSGRIDRKREEVKDLRDALVNASGVLESRAAVSQADTVYTMTVLMILYLPATTVISVFGMDIIPSGSQTLTAFGITMGTVFLATIMLGFNLGSVLTFFSLQARKMMYRLQSSMRNFGGAWKRRSDDLKDISDAELLLAREKRIPITWFYTWYALMWGFIAFPVQELRSIGGARELVKGKSTQLQENWLWNGVMVPLRVVMLPVHAVVVGMDYLLLLIFGEAIVGKKEKDELNEDVIEEILANEVDSGKNGVVHETIPLNSEQSETAGSKTEEIGWGAKFKKPVTVIKEFAHFGLGDPEEQVEVPDDTTKEPLPADDSQTTAPDALDISDDDVQKSLTAAVARANERSNRLRDDSQEYSEEESSCSEHDDEDEEEDDDDDDDDDSDDDDDDDDDDESEQDEDEEEGNNAGNSENPNPEQEQGDGEQHDVSSDEGGEHNNTDEGSRRNSSATLLKDKPTELQKPKTSRGSISELMSGIIARRKSQDQDLERGQV